MQAAITKEGDAVSLKPLWGAVWAMSLCAMVLIASEFLPVSLLTPIAGDLSITEGHAGQSISISGLFALLTSLFLTAVIGDIDRRKILLFFTMLMAVSGVMVAFAPNATLLMLGRALLGMCIGGFWSMSTATVMRLVPKKAVPKAMAVLNGGNALATTIAAPLGSFLGDLVGWRGAFFSIVPLALIAFAWQWRVLPALPSLRSNNKKASVGAVFGLLKDRVVAVGMATTMLFFMGQFALFTYLRPFLETVTGVTVGMLSIILLVMGVFGLIGTLLIGRLMEKHLFTVLIAAPFIMMLIAGGLIVFGHCLVITLTLLSVWGLVGTSVPVAWFTWLSRTLPNKAEAGGGLMVALIQLAITFGAALGGVLFDMCGYKSTFMLSVIVLMMGSLMACVMWRQVGNATKTLGNAS